MRPHPASTALPALAAAAVLACLAPAGGTAAPEPTAGAQRTLALVKQWVHGQYDNRAQFEADIARKVPAGEIHRRVNQFFAPVTVAVPGIEGYLVYQHASADGSLEPRTIFRVGLLQFITDPATGKLVQRELNFRNGEPWKNAHLKPALLAKATMADVNVNPGCDFHLEANAAGTEVAGRMKERACTMWSDGLKMTLYAEDAVLIRPDEYHFWGRFVDDAGQVRWGTQSRELYRLVRVSAP
jgi:hypothetical protein